MHLCLCQEKIGYELADSSSGATGAEETDSPTNSRIARGPASPRRGIASLRIRVYPPGRLANRGATSATYRLSIRPNGASQEDKHYLAYDVPIGGNDSTALTLGITADASDIIAAYCSTDNISINVFGSEITN